MSFANRSDDWKTTRVPLVGSFNTRSFWSATGNTSSSGYIGVGVIGQMIIGSSLIATQDQRFVNAIPDTVENQVTGTKKYYVYKRPGFETHSTPSAGDYGTAVHIWIGQGSGNKVISAFGTTNSEIFDGTTSLGTTTGQVSAITETMIGSTPNLTMVTNTGRGYFYPSGGSLTEISDADYPYNASQTPVGRMIHLNGYAFVLTQEGNIFNSVLNSVSSWTATGYLSTNLYPDRGVTLARLKNIIVAFGQESTEFFKLTDNDTGSPLQAIQEIGLNIGAYEATAVTTMEDKIAWVASSGTGSISVYLMSEPGNPQRISTDEIDFQLTSSGSSDVYLTNIKVFGKTLIFLVFGSATYVYSLEDQMWHQWSSREAVLWHQFAANTATSPVLYSISRNTTSGKVYKINTVTPVFTDDGTTFDMSIQTSKIDLNSVNRKFLTKIGIVGDQTTSSTTLTVQWSDDDYNSWSAARPIDLSDINQYLRVGGSFRRRAFRFTNRSSLPLRLEAIELEYKEGSK